MEEKALLILVGGRQTPNLLSAQHWQPDIIFPVASSEAIKDGTWTKLKQSLDTLKLSGKIKTIETPKEVDAFDLHQIRQACHLAFKHYPKAKWLFNITCATTIMSIGAYEVANEKKIAICYLDTTHRRVVAWKENLLKGDLYKISVADYLKLYIPKGIQTHNLPTENQIIFANFLANKYRETMSFRDKLRELINQKLPASDDIFVKEKTDFVKQLLLLAKQAEFLKGIKEQVNGFICELSKTNSFWKFIDGTWLEVYVYATSKKAKCFDDYCCNVNLLLDAQEIAPSNQIDFTATYSGSLLIAECKTDREPFKEPAKKGYLDKLFAIAGRVGGSYVSTMFICSQISSYSPNTYEGFSQLAKERKIVVVTGEQLCNLEKILKNEVKTPTYSRS